MKGTHRKGDDSKGHQHIKPAMVQKEQATLGLSGAYGVFAESLSQDSLED